MLVVSTYSSQVLAEALRIVSSTIDVEAPRPKRVSVKKEYESKATFGVHFSVASRGSVIFFPLTHAETFGS